MLPGQKWDWHRAQSGPQQQAILLQIYECTGQDAWRVQGGRTSAQLAHQVFSGACDLALSQQPLGGLLMQATLPWLGIHSKNIKCTQHHTGLLCMVCLMNPKSNPDSAK
jgi:hypothetical protein